MLEFLADHVRWDFVPIMLGLILLWQGFKWFQRRQEESSGGQGQKHAAPGGPAALKMAPVWTTWKKTTRGVSIYDVVVQEGTMTQFGSRITVHYVGWLFDPHTGEVGSQFDSSRNRKEGFTFRLGANSVIPGWEEGLLSLTPGSKRLLVIPPALAYGAVGAPPQIPPHATLLFEVEVLNISDGPATKPVS